MEVDPINIVVVGRVGDYKSATGNSILGKEAFISDYSLMTITCSSELKSAILNDGRIVNIIDTPGLFEFSTNEEVVSGEIVKCLNLAKDGIHAVLMVFSLRTCFSKEENIVQQFKNRVIVLDNTTDDMIKRQKQVNELLSLVESVAVENGGKPCTNKFFEKPKVEEKGKLSMERIWKQLVEEQAARLEAEE